MSRSRHLVDPDLLGLVEFLPDLTLNDETLPAIRANPFPTVDDGVGLGEVDIERRMVPGPAGAPEVPVMIYRPKGGSGPRACILHIHGGGYVIGSAASGEPQHRAIAHNLGCCIVSVDYRLAPETPHPGPVEDCYAALAWLVGAADALGVDRKRIGVMGESAGGGLAAGLALLARDRGEYPLAFQHLIYPMIDDRTCVAADPHPYTGEILWTPEANRYGWRSLLGTEPGSPGVSPYAAAARAEDLTGLPPTFMYTGALDLFLEENIDYARRLLRAGVPTEFHVYPGAFHGFELGADAGVVKAARRDRMAALARAVGAPIKPA